MRALPTIARRRSHGAALVGGGSGAQALRPYEGKTAARLRLRKRDVDVTLRFGREPIPREFREQAHGLREVEARG